MNLANWVGPPLMSGDLQGAAYNGAYSLMKDFVGYDLDQKKWTGGNMLETYGAIFMGYVGHKLASKFGVNRTIGKIPFLGKYIEL